MCNFVFHLLGPSASHCRNLGTELVHQLCSQGGNPVLLSLLLIRGKDRWHVYIFFLHDGAASLGVIFNFFVIENGQKNLLLLVKWLSLIPYWEMKDKAFW